MGAEQSNSSGSSRSERDRGKYSKEEVNRILEHQRILFEKKFKELSQNNTTAHAQETAREEARKEVERIIKEQEKRNRQTTETVIPGIPPLHPKSPASVLLERDSAPYSFTGKDLQSNPTIPSTSGLYPNLSNEASTSSVELSSTRSDDNSQRSLGVLTSAMSHGTASECGSSVLTSVRSHRTASGCGSGVLTSVRSHGSASECGSSVLTSLRSRGTASECGSSVLTSLRSRGTASECGSSVLTTVRSHKTVTGCSPKSHVPVPRNPVKFDKTPSGSGSGEVTTATLHENTPAKLSGTSCDEKTFRIEERFKPSAPPAPRDRSISRNRNGSRSSATVRNSNEDDELNCPTCKNCFTLPIFQCQRGHSSCLYCKNKLACCGICGLPITNMRNITLEAYIGERKINCQNSDAGCHLSFKLDDMENHLKECPFSEMQCPLTAIFGQCQWRGKLPQMAAHFDDVHQMHRQGNVDTEMRLLNISHDNQIVYFVVLGTFNFLFHVKVSEKDRMMYMTVQLIGTQHSASKWSYEIQIYNKAEPRRKYEYSDICNSINYPLNSIIADSKCAAIPLSYANTFVNNDCVLYKFYLKKDAEGRNNNFGNKNHRGRGPRRRY